MIRIKLCGLTRPRDIRAANELKPDYVGFVFAPKSRRYVTPHQAEALKAILDPGIQAVGVFVNEPLQRVADLLDKGIIDLAQLHGSEDGDYVRSLKACAGKPVIQAFRVAAAEDIRRAEESPADFILLDSGAGTGTVFDWTLLETVKRPYFLAGGLGLHNVAQAVARLHPYAVDVSSGIETDGVKDPDKMAVFVDAVRKEDGI